MAYASKKTLQAGAMALVGPPAPRHIIYGSSQLVPVAGIFFSFFYWFSIFVLLCMRPFTNFVNLVVSFSLLQPTSGLDGAPRQ